MMQTRRGMGAYDASTGILTMPNGTRVNVGTVEPINSTEPGSIEPVLPDVPTYDASTGYVVYPDGKRMFVGPQSVFQAQQTAATNAAGASWFSQSSIVNGVPNAVLAFAGVALFGLLMGGKKR